MILTRPVDRRTFLRASGVAMGLPLLESMSPALARAAAVEAPRRMVTICSTLGLYSSSWFPRTAGAGYEATEYLRLIDEHRSRYTLFSGFSHEEQSGRQPHNSEITWLTAARRPGLDGFRNTVSLDQVAANELGYVTRFPSVVLGTLSAQSQVVHHERAPWCRPRRAPPTCSRSSSCRARPRRSSARRRA